MRSSRSARDTEQTAIGETLMVKELTHFIGGKHVKGTSGRFSDGFQPMTGEVISKVPLAGKAEVRSAVENALAGLGGHQPAAAGAGADEFRRPCGHPQ
jgi:hypothetical protein